MIIKYLISLKKSLFLLLVLFVSSLAHGQNDIMSLRNLNPVSPTAFQFQKYTDVPVSKYTGVPNISIPLYQITEDGLNVPISLSYYARGIRVTQEASNVGLGWDLNFGSVIQNINDRDDLGKDTYGNPFIKELPDFNMTGGNPTAYPRRYQYPCTSDGIGWTSTVSINPVQPYYGYKIATDYYLPVNGDFTNKHLDLLTSRSYDSESDIFTANFFGHSINFIIDFKSQGQTSIVVLNKNGYSVQRNYINGNVTWEIIVPSGEHYFFQEISNVESNSSGYDYNGSFGSGYEISSRMWLITKIVTIYGKEIIFNYSKGSLSESFPNYSEKSWDTTGFSHDTYNMSQFTCGYDGITAYDNIFISGKWKTYSTTREEYHFLNSITFPMGTIELMYSDRLDLNGNKKIDTIKVKNLDGLIIKQWQLNYSYFDAANAQGNGYTYASGSDISGEQRASLRLKLNSLIELNAGQYKFVYNAMPLPKKNSFAQDLWGFYNGKTSNVSLEINPSSNFIGHPEMGNNGNDRYSELESTKACVLNEIQYPTGGKVIFNYELNEFKNTDLLSDVPISNNIIPKGNGLRISDITIYDGANKLTKKNKFTYSGGQLNVQKRLCRSFSIFRISNLGLNSSSTDSWRILEYSSNGIYSPNQFTSSNSIGYDMVTTSDVDGQNNALGRTEETFWNTQDYYTNLAETYPNAVNVGLPAIKNTTNPLNGLTKSTKIYNSNNFLQKTIEYDYINIVSGLYYGARILPYPNVKYGFLHEGNFSVLTYAKNMVGFYPIQDYQSLLSKITENEYDKNGILHTQTINNSYDGFDQKIFSQTRGSNNEYIEEYFDHATDYSARTGNTALLNAHRYTDVTRYTKQRRQSNYISVLAQSSSEKSYSNVLGNVVTTSLLSKVRDINGALPKMTTLNQYDNSGNPLEITNPDGITTSMLWNYNNHYLTAQTKNSNLNDVAATSFEADNKGQCVYTGIPVIDNNAPTGAMVYPLQNAPVTVTISSASRNYFISLWSNNNTIKVNGVSPTTTGRTVNGYTYYEWNINGSTSYTISTSVSANIDELRVYPKSAEMTTYTYIPLVGISSQCDANNKITYYEYDNGMRLKTLRDQDKNILKVFDYQFQAQINQ